MQTPSWVDGDAVGGTDIYELAPPARRWGALSERPWQPPTPVLKSLEPRPQLTHLAPQVSCSPVYAWSMHGSLSRSRPWSWHPGLRHAPEPRGRAPSHLHAIIGRSQVGPLCSTPAGVFLPTLLLQPLLLPDLCPSCCLCLEQCYSKCGPQTSSINVTGSL